MSKDDAAKAGEPRDLQSSHHDASGDMGVSSEREDEHGTDGVRDTSTVEDTGDTPPEQAPGAVEENPEGIPPKAGYPKADPRSD